MSGLAELLGQPAATRTLERALASGRVHHAYRFEGPSGVGKRLAASLLARALLCDVGGGCGACSACRRVSSVATEPPHVPAHPDVIHIGRGLYPASMVGGSEVTGISVEQIRRILQPRIGFPPHEGKALVVTVFDAEELTVSAANALLKTLEEPPSGVHFILLTDRPQRLLDTIRSRTLAIRFGPLPSAIVQQIAAKEGLDGSLAPRAHGQMTRLAELGDPERRGEIEKFALSSEAAQRHEHPVHALTFADERPDGRDALLTQLGHLAEHYAAQARSANHPARAARSFREVERAKVEIERNGSPALVLEALMLRLQGIRAESETNA